MAFQDTNNLVDTIVETQKKVLDSVVENTKKFTNGNSSINETIEKGTDWYKNWLENQKNTITKTLGGNASTAGDAKETPNAAADAATKANEFFQNWMTTQMDLAKKMWDASQEAAKNFSNPAAANMFTNPFTTNNPFTASNPFAAFQNGFGNMQNPFASYMNNAAYTNWMNQAQNMNPFNADAFKKANETMSGMFSQYYSLLNNTFSDWQKNLENGTIQDAYKSMINVSEGFTKFAEMWTPMFKSMQDKTFNMDAYKKMMNPEMYKEFMDKFFSFMPDGSREHATNMTRMMSDYMKQMGTGGMDQFAQMRNMMNSMNNGQQMFGNMYNSYNQFQNMMTEAAAPFTKMMTPNEHTKTAAAWNDIMNRVTAYNIKNAELQYMVYTQGTKVMDKLAENIAKKVQDGTEVTSMLGLYQEWLNISDKVYVSLFESDEYSKQMAEVTAMQNKLRRDINLQLEKMMKDVPVATRSEMDEVYKTIYDLKKQVRQLEKMLELDNVEVAEEPKAEKAAKSKKA